MAEEIGEERDLASEFQELLGFLQDPKPEVQRIAAEGVLSFTENEDFIKNCLAAPRKAARPLLRLVEKAEAAAQEAAGAAAPKEEGSAPRRQSPALEVAENAAAGSAALQALINLSAMPAVRDELISLSAPRRCVEALRAGWLEGRAEYAHWYAMLLANLSTAEAGQKALCEQEALTKFLWAAYVARPRPPAVDGHDDPLRCLGKVLCNLCVLPEGRRVLAGSVESGPALGQFAAELADRNRRADVLAAFQNLCLDKECHETVARTPFMSQLARFLYPWEKSEPDRRANLPEALQEVLKAEESTMTADDAIRRSSMSCIRGLCQTKAGREHLRSWGCYEVLRAWHAHGPETEADIIAMIEAAVSWVHYSEDEIKTEGGADVLRREAETEQVPSTSPESGATEGGNDEAGASPPEVAA